MSASFYIQFSVIEPLQFAKSPNLNRQEIPATFSLA